MHDRGAVQASLNDVRPVPGDRLTVRTRTWLREQIARGDGGELLGSGYQATVTRYSTPEGSVVVKSPHPRGLKGLAGRIAIRREHRTYQRLDGIAGIPRCLALLDERHLVLEHIDGPSLRSYEADADADDAALIYTRLLATINAMHAAGVAHADLKRKDNVIVGPGQQPYLIDFGIASLDPPDRRGLAHRRFEYLKQLDYNAWIKLKYRRELDGMSAVEAARYSPLWLERIARWLRIPWQALTLRRPRQRWRARRDRRKSPD